MARILVIDDEALVRDTIKQTLERAGYEVAEAADGREGLGQFHEQPADLVITDILMPGQEGIETIRILHKEFPLTKILAISGGGRGNLEVLPSAKTFGAHHTLAKPFEREALLAAVRALLD